MIQSVLHYHGYLSTHLHGIMTKPPYRGRIIAYIRKIAPDEFNIDIKGILANMNCRDIDCVINLLDPM